MSKMEKIQRSGWKRNILQNKKGQTIVTFTSPKGTEIRDKTTLKRHLQARRSQVTFEDFIWEVNKGEEEKKPAQAEDRKELAVTDTEGQESGNRHDDTSTAIFDLDEDLDNSSNATLTNSSVEIIPCSQTDKEASYLSDTQGQEAGSGYNDTFTNISNLADKEDNFLDMNHINSSLKITPSSQTDKDAPEISVIPSSQPARRSITSWDMPTLNKVRDQRDELQRDLTKLNEDHLLLQHDFMRLQEESEQAKTEAEVERSALNDRILALQTYIDERDNLIALKDKQLEESQRTIGLLQDDLSLLSKAGSRADRHDCRELESRVTKLEATLQVLLSDDGYPKVRHAKIPQNQSKLNTTPGTDVILVTPVEDVNIQEIHNAVERKNSTKSTGTKRVINKQQSQNRACLPKQALKSTDRGCKNNRTDKTVIVQEINSTPKINSKMVSTVVMGDSIVKHTDMHLKKHGMAVVCKPGIRIDQLSNFITNLTDIGTNHLIIHVGTNDIKKARTPDDIMDKINSLIVKTKIAFPTVTITISGVVQRRDEDPRYVNAVNDSIRWISEKLGCHFIDPNSGLTDQDLGKDGLHLNRRGSKKLADLFIQQHRLSRNASKNL